MAYLAVTFLRYYSGMSQPHFHEQPLLPYGFARAQHVLAVPAGGRMQVYFSPSASPAALAEAARVSTLPVAWQPTDASALDRLLQTTYRGAGGDASVQLIASMEQRLDLSSLAAAIPEKEDVLSQEQEAPVIRMINALLTEALAQKASDIHIETSETQVVVRFRVDGVLREVIRLKRTLSALLISRIKIMAKLDIAEKRLPQDGHIMLRSASHEFDIRVSTIPGAHAERVVMRLLDKELERCTLGGLGMSARDLGALNSIIAVPHGIVLVTGPTGSGKTTTLYAALSALNDGKRSILTIEDPIEINLDGVGQTEVNPKIDMSFARGLRAILRQDPDIIMVGEIRDADTAQIAVQASLTGHLVFSTLHTNSAVGAVTRLMDMGVEPYLLSSSLAGLVAQRLVRRLCRHCKREAALGVADAEQLHAAPGCAMWEAVGCEQCRHTGYDGRIGLYEVVQVDAALRALVHDRAPEAQLEQAVRRANPSMRDDARAKLLAGETSVDEIRRVLE